jgi:hypothetical protein
MKKNVARILRYALEQLVIVERLKSVTAEVTKGTGRAVASIHNVLWLLESEDSEVPAVKRLRSYPSTKAEAEALQEFLDTDVVIHESIIEKKYEEAFGSPATPPQVDPPGGWTPEAIDAAKFPESVKQTAQLSFVAKPLNFLPEMVGGDEIQEASAFNYVFQISGHTPAKWRYGTAQEISRRAVLWAGASTFSEAIDACNAVWRELLSKYVTVAKSEEQNIVSQFDDAIRQICNLTRCSDEDRDALTVTAQRIWISTPNTASSIAGKMIELAKQGFGPSEIIKTTTTLMSNHRKDGSCPK